MHARVHPFLPFRHAYSQAAVGEGGALPMSADPDPIKILTTDAEVAGWNTDGLPNDQVCFACYSQHARVAGTRGHAGTLDEQFVVIDPSFARTLIDEGVDGKRCHRLQLCTVASNHRSTTSGAVRKVLFAIRRSWNGVRK